MSKKIPAIANTVTESNRFKNKKEFLIKTNESFASRLDKDFDDLNSRAIEGGYKIPCKVGCSACCYQIVTINITDAVRIANRIISMNDDEIDKIKKAAEKSTKINRRIKYDSQRWAEQVPCSFLVNNLCSIYDDRPVVCRATNTIEEEGYCDQLLNDKNPRGHEVFGITAEGYSNLEIEMALLNPLLDAGLISDKDIRLKLLCTQIDLDKLALFMAQPKAIREGNLVKLISIDKRTLNSLKKRSVNIDQEDEQVVLNR
jgi:Fe-S-cluster containining protein